MRGACSLRPIFVLGIVQGHCIALFRSDRSQLKAKEHSMKLEIPFLEGICGTSHTCDVRQKPIYGWHLDFQVILL